MPYSSYSDCDIEDSIYLKEKYWKTYNLHSPHVFRSIDECFIFSAPQQGLPTSPLIANLAFLDCDNKILSELKRLKIDSVYTRYADDLIISFNNKEHVKKIISLVSNIVEIKGFKINKKKTKVQNIKNGRIIITGVGIDKDGVYPTRKTLKNIRAAKHSRNNSSLRGLVEWSKCKLPKIKQTNDITNHCHPVNRQKSEC